MVKCYIELVLFFLFVLIVVARLGWWAILLEYLSDDQLELFKQVLFKQVLFKHLTIIGSILLWS